MDDSDLLTMLILAAVAGFLLFRLRNVLGERGGFESKEGIRRAPFKGDAERPEGEESNVVPMPNRATADEDEDIFAFAEMDSDLGQALKKIKTAEPGWNAHTFMDGAKGAYEMLLTAFEAGDKSALQPFLSDDVFAAFSSVIDERSANNLSADMRFVGIKTSEPVAASFDENSGLAEITVRFVAEVILAVRDAQGEVVEGDPSAVSRINDTWTFSRNMGGSDPNWILTATGE